MTVTMPEPECVVLKRRGAAEVAKLLSGLSAHEQLAFWRKRTQAMLMRQKAAHPRATLP